MRLGSMKLLLVLTALAGALVLPVSARATVPPECTSAVLHASFTTTGAGMSHQFGTMRLTNVSAGSCWVRGYDGLSFVKHRGGVQVGSPAQRTPSLRPRVLLAPGGAAVSEVSITTTGPYDPATCRPTRVDGFRVYPPDSRTPKFVRFATTTCANPALVMLQHKAYRRA